MIDNFRPTVYVNNTFRRGTLNITDFGEYDAEDENYDGYSTVTCYQGGDIPTGYMLKYNISDFFTTWAEGGMQVSIVDPDGTVGQDPAPGIHVVWNGDSHIGCIIHGAKSIKGAQSINYDIVVGESYAHQTGDDRNFDLHIGVTSDMPTGNSMGTIVAEDVWIATDYAEQRLTGSIDLSELSGDIYPFIYCPGWNLDAESFEFEF